MKSPIKISISFFFALCALFAPALSQTNLVPNFSFEIYDTCPNAPDQIQYALGWNKYSNINSTPDYYNSCAPATGFGVPKNIACYQPSHRNCSAYAALVTWGTTSNAREYAGIQLNQPLITGQKYYISFYTVMAGYFAGGNYYDMPSNNIGIRLSTVAYNPSNPCPIDNFAHLRSIVVINDSINWMRISGSIVADSAYNYLIVGNFFDDANTDTINYNCGNCWNSFSYYFVDDVCLSTDSLLCNGGIDLLPCNVSVNENIFDDGVSVFPNPASDFVTLTFQNNQNAEILLYDVFGNIIYDAKTQNETVFNIPLSPFSKGYYILKIINENKLPITKKIIRL